jgi:hypothetical protein
MALAVESNASPWLTPTKRAIEAPYTEQPRKAISSPNGKESNKDPSRKVSFSKKVRVVEYFVRKNEDDFEYTSWFTVSWSTIKL